MIVNETIYVMLGEHKNYLSLIDKPIADPASSEVILTLSCSSPRRDSHHHFNGNLSRCTPSERT
jgi:predicted lactoylglutathione lyase